MIYLLGDSHANEIAQSKISRSVQFTHQTLLGFGLQGFVGSSKFRLMDENVRQLIKERLAGLEKNSLLLLSYTDIDARIGMGDTGYKTILDDYKRAFEFFYELCEPQKIIVLDWYGIISSKTHEQSCSVEQRMINRKKQIEALEKLDIEYNSTINDFVDEDGFTSVKMTRDGVHYDFNNEELFLALNERFCELVMKED